VGCNLCSIVCPVEGAITMAEVPSDAPPMTWNQRKRTLDRLSPAAPASCETADKEAV